MSDAVLLPMSIGIPIVIDEHMPSFSWSMHDDKIWTDSMDTVEAELNHEFLRSCGIASEKPRYIPMPNLLTI